VAIKSRGRSSILDAYVRVDASTHTSALMREHTMQLLIAAFAIGLCMFERARMIGEQKTEITENITVDKTTTQAAPRYHV
jgi:hypothetical protein